MPARRRTPRRSCPWGESDGTCGWRRGRSLRRGPAPAAPRGRAAAVAARGRRPERPVPGRGRGPRLQRGPQSRGERHAPPPRISTSPSPSAPWSRSSTTAAPTARLWSPSAWPRRVDGVQALILTRKGRGYALRTAWSASEADVVAYMDVDLSTSLSGLLPLVGSVLSGHSDLAVGTRLARGSRVVRGPKRELISRALQPHGAAVAAQPRLRLPVWLQGHPARARAADPAAGRRRRVVLRHRADRDGRAARRAHLGDPGRVDRRPDLVGGHRAHGPGRPARDLADGAAPPATGPQRTHADVRQRAEVRPPPISCFPSPGWAC